MCVVVGNSEYAEMLMEYLEESGVTVNAFCADSGFIDNTVINGRDVISTDEMLVKYPPSKTILYLGIGYSKLGRIRKNLYFKMKSKGYRFGNYIHVSSVLHRGHQMGEGNVIFENVVIQRGTVLGNGNLVFSNGTIMHDNIIGNFNTFGAGSVSNGFVQIGDCNFVGSNATLRDHISIGSDCLIGAGSYVDHNCENGDAVLPAKNSIYNGEARKISEKL